MFEEEPEDDYWGRHDILWQIILGEIRFLNEVLCTCKQYATCLRRQKIVLLILISPLGN